MKKDDILYSFYVLFHPLDGFWDLKNEKRGRLSVAFLYMGCWFATNIVAQMLTGYLFNPDYGNSLDIFKEFRTVFLLFLLFTVGNWSVTTLMDGKGLFRDIIMVFGYACIPLTLLRIPAVLISNVVSEQESFFYYVLVCAAWAWFFILLFIGMMMVHDFSFQKAVGTLILTITAMLILVFLALVFYNILSTLISFILAAYKELSMRL